MISGVQLSLAQVLLSPNNLPLFWMAKSQESRHMVTGLAHTSIQLCAAAAKQVGWNFYVGLNPPKSDFIGTKPAKTDISHLSCIGIDVDPISAGEGINSLYLLSALARMNVKPQSVAIVHSGRGIWAWVLVRPAPITDNDVALQMDQLVKGFVRRLATILDPVAGKLDTSCAEISRVARCPGTMNCRTNQMSHILLMPDEPDRLPLEDLQEIAQGYEPPIFAPREPGHIDSLFHLLPALNASSRQFVIGGADTAVESRHRRLYSTAKNIREIGTSEDLAGAVLRMAAAKCNPVLPPDEVTRVVAQVYREVTKPSNGNSI